MNEHVSLVPVESAAVEMELTKVTLELGQNSRECIPQCGPDCQPACIPA
jgi:hypothetical protein